MSETLQHLRFAIWISFFAVCVFFIFFTQVAHAATVNISGTLYSDEGSTAITTGKTIKLAVGTSTVSVQSATSDGSGDFTFAIDNGSGYSAGTPLLVWVDGDSVKANHFTKASSSVTDIVNLDLYQSRVIVSHEASSTATSTSNLDLSFYDSSDDSDVQYTASSTLDSLEILNGSELHIWNDATFVNAASSTFSGSFHNEGVFDNNSSTITFNGTPAELVGGDGVNSSWADSTYEYVSAIVSHNGTLYAGLGSDNDDAEVWSWNGANDWTQIGGDSLNSGWTTSYNNVWSLVTYNDNLYAGLGNGTGQDEVWEWGGSSWTQIGGDSVNSSWLNHDRVYAMVVHGGDLYAGLAASTGHAEVWKYNGSTWSLVGGDAVNSSWADATYEYVRTLESHNGKLYAGLGQTTTEGEVWEYNGSTWTQIGGDGVNSSWNTDYENVTELASFNGKLYAGLGSTNGDAEVWEWDGASDWTLVGGDGTGWADSTYNIISSFIVHNGKLYAGLGFTTGEAELWSYDGVTWTQVAGDGLNSSWADSSYEYVFSLGSHNGLLYAGLGNDLGDGEIWRIGAEVSGSLIGSSALNDVVVANDVFFIDNASTSDLTISAGATLVAPAEMTIDGDLIVATSSTFKQNGADTTISGDLYNFGTLQRIGDNWATTSVPNISDWDDVVYGNGLFVASAVDGATGVMTSPDGINWTNQTIPSVSPQFFSIAYGKGLFVAVARNGVNRIITSPDGVNWTDYAAPENNQWYIVEYGGDKFVALSSDGTNRVMYSTDGANWSTSSAATDINWRGLTYGNGQFVAVANSGSGNQVMTSSDGVSWTSQSTPADRGWLSVTYGNGVYVAVAYNAATNNIMTSSDGVSWTARNAPSGAGTLWTEVDFVNGLFVAVSKDGAGIMTSPDGVNWTAHQGPDDSDWDGIAFGNNRLVVVSHYGTSSAMYYDLGTTTFNGSSAQTVSGSTTIDLLFGNIELIGSDTVTFEGDVFATDFDINSGATTVAPEQLTLSGNFNNDGTFTAGNTIMSFVGTDPNLSGTLVESSKLSGVLIDSNASTTFLNNASTSDLTISAGATLVAPAELTINGSYTNSGRFDENGGTVYFSGDGSYNVSSAKYNDWCCSGYSSMFTGFGIAVSPDGSKLFVLRQNELINEYSLSTPYDINSAATLLNSMDISGRDSEMTAITFSPDGDKMYVTGSTADSVYRYDLGTPWDTTTASYVNSTSVNAQDTHPVGVAFSTNGDKMFVLGRTNDKYFEYTLSTPWDITSKTYVDGLSVVAESSWHHSLVFSDDGTKAFSVRGGGTQLFEYTFATPWDVSTGYHSGTIIVEENNGDLYGLDFSDSGHKLFVQGINNGKLTVLDIFAEHSGVLTGESSLGDVVIADKPQIFSSPASTTNFTINQNAIFLAPTSTLSVRGNYQNNGTLTANDGSIDFTGTSTTISGNLVGESDFGTVSIYGSSTFSSNASTTNLIINSGATVTAPSLLSIDGEYINNGTFNSNSGTVYSISNNFDISDAGYIKYFSTAGQDTAPYDVSFSSNGDKMFVLGGIGDDVNEYNLGTAWDVSTASFVDSFSVTSQENQPHGLAFSATGSKMFVIGITGDDVNEYTLGTAWDVSTASFVDSFSVLVEAENPRDVSFSSTGDKMFVTSFYGENVCEYNMGANFDVSTSVLVDCFSISAEESSPYGLAFSNAGDRMFLSGTDGSDVNEYTLGTAWDVSTASFARNFSVIDQDAYPYGLAFSTIGDKMYIIGANSDSVIEYQLDPLPTFSGDMLGSSAFENLIIVGSNSFVFSDAASTTGNLVATNISSTSIIFNYGDTYTFQNFQVVGGNQDTKISLLSSSSTNDWYLIVPGNATTAFAYIQDSDACGSAGGGLEAALSTDGGNNTCWTFGTGPTTTISGILYSDEGTTPITSGKVVKLFIDSYTDTTATTTTNGSGAYSFGVPQLNIDSGSPLFTFVDGDGSTKAVSITKFSDSISDISDQDLYKDFVILKSESTTTPLAVSDLALYTNTNDSDIKYDIGVVDLSTPYFGFETATVTPLTTYGDGLWTVTTGDKNSGTYSALADGSVIGDNGSGHLELDIESESISFAYKTSSESGWDYLRFYINDVLQDEWSGANAWTQSNSYSLPPGVNTVRWTYSKDTCCSEGTDQVWIDDIRTGLIVSDSYIQDSGLTTYLWDDSAFTVDKTMFLNGNAGGAGDGDLILKDNSVLANDNDIYLPGSLVVGSGVGFTGTSDLIFTATTTGKTLSGTMVGDSKLPNLNFSGNGGEWSFSNNASTTDITIGTNATMTAPIQLSVSGDYVNNGAFDSNSGTLYASEMYSKVEDFSYVTATSVAAQEGSLAGLSLNPDGTKMFTVGFGNDSVYEYTLTTAWDITTVNYTISKSVAVQSNTPNGLAFSTDGTKMFVTAWDSDSVLEYNLSSAWDVTSASYVDSFSVLAEEDSIYDVAFSYDGSKMFVSGGDVGEVHEYGLSVAWDVSTASYVDSLDVSIQERYPDGVIFSEDGYRMYLSGDGSSMVREYLLTSSFDISTAILLSSLSVSSQDGAPYGLSVSSDYSTLYVLGQNNDSVYQYDLGAGAIFSGNMIGSSALNHLEIVNPIPFEFTDSASTTGTFTANLTATNTITFNAGSSYTFQNVDWSGVSTSSPLTLKSSASGTEWYLDVPGSQLNVQYVDVQDSNASLSSGGTIYAASSTDSGNNSNWIFGAAPESPTGSTTISDHDDTQVNNAFDYQNKTAEPLFAFKLTPESGNATVTDLVINISQLKNVDPSDFTNIKLYRDHNADGQYDIGDTEIGGAGVMTYADITFSTDFLSTTTENYLVIADWTAPSNGSVLRLDLLKTGITAVDDSGAIDVFGSVRRAQHSRNNQGGGGGTRAAVGDDAPEGDGDVGGGTNEGGELIGDDPDYRWPSANSGSWSTPSNAYDQVDGTYATTNSVNTNNFTNHSFVVPGTNTIEGVEVKLEVSGTTAAGDIDVELSWDGGTTWTTAKTTPTLTTTDTVITLGGPSDKWGRVSWSTTDFSNANFVVRLTGNVSGNTVQVDAMQVRVYHQATGGGAGGGGGI